MTELSAWPGSTDVEFLPQPGPYTDIGWNIAPDGLEELLLHLATEFPALPLMITENGAAFPDRLLRTDEAAALLVRDHVGRYGQARTVVEVTLDDQGALHLGVAPRNQDVAATSRLRAADRGVFLTESRGNPEFQFVQFIADEASPGTAYLWNGRQIWRREPDPR